MSSISQIKHVLVVVDGAEHSLTAVDQALAYAGMHEAALTIVVVTENLAFAAAADAMAFAQAITVSEDQRDEHLAAVRERTRNTAIEVEVHSVFEASGLIPGLVKAEGQYADIALIPGVGRWQRDGLRRRISEALLFTGVPTVILPASWNPGPIDHAVLGWNASLESFRAARALLNLAEPDARIDVAIVDDPGVESGEHRSGVQIARLFARHGHSGGVCPISSSGKDTSAVLQNYAVEQKADVLVIGGYGRSRALEFVLGGVTRELIDHQRLPIVFVH